MTFVREQKKKLNHAKKQIKEIVSPIFFFNSILCPGEVGEDEEASLPQM
jgi:hypothetical protein